MKFLPGERLLHEAGGKLTITTHRIRYERKGGGTATIKGIMLEEIASCAMMRKTYPILLLLATVCALGGLLLTVSAGVMPLVLGVVFAVGLGVVYLLSREQVVAIASAGATIYINTHGWPLENVRELIDQVEAAKNTRYLVLRGQPVVAARS